MHRSLKGAHTGPAYAQAGSNMARMWVWSVTAYGAGSGGWLGVSGGPAQLE